MWIRRGLQSALLVLAVLTLVGMAVEMVRLPSSPVLGMSERDTRVGLVRPGGPAWQAGLRDDDRILAIEGQPTARLADPSAFLRARGTQPSRLLVQRDGAEFAVTLVPEALVGAEMAWQIAHAVTAGATLLIGTWVLRQRASELTVVFFAICWAIAFLSFRPAVPPGDLGPLVLKGAVTAVSAALPGVLLHFFLLFPFERRAVRTRPWLLGLVYAPAFVFVPVNVGISLPALTGTTERERLGALSEQGVAAYWILALVLSLALFVGSFRSSALPVVRSKLRVTLFGALAGLLPLLVVLLLRAAWPGLHLPGDRLASVALVLVPATFGYAILRHGIFEAEILVQRGLVYSAATSAFVLLYFLAFFGLRSVLRGTEGFEGRIGTALALAFVLLLLSPLRSRLQERIDRWVYPDRFYIQRPLRETALRLREAQDPDSVQAATLEALDAVLRVERAVLFRVDGDGLVGRAARGLELPATPLRLGHHVAAPLFASSRPLVRAELEDALAYGYLPSADLAVLEAVEARVFLPLVSPRGRLGALVLGPRAFDERYAEPDLELLEGFQHQAALALENASLETERRGHVSLTEELGVARSIQRELLPREVPRLAQADLAASNRACSAVGGDYYDCALLPDGSLALAIADVTGHGVPAALLMANLQAIFRAEILANRGPGEVLRTINERLCAIERPERFATCFTARWEPETGRLRYANGGHYAPVVVRRKGGTLRLSEGGPVLGILPNAEFEVGETLLAPGDLLLAFTDGVVEQGGPEGRFQEEELVAFLEKHRHLSSRDLLGRIEERIDPSASEAFIDDTTLLALKRL